MAVVPAGPLIPDHHARPEHTGGVNERWRRSVLIAAAVASALAAAAAPGRQRFRHFDHDAFREAIRRIHGGAGLYEGFVAGMNSIGSFPGQVRAVREPWLFGVLALLPTTWVQPAFFVSVVFASAAVSASIAARPMIGLVIGAYLALVGIYGGIDVWLVSELWCVPLILGACAAWLRGRDGWAAALVVAAVLVRETTAPLLFTFGAAALAQRRPLRPWGAGIGVTVAALALHWYLASDWLADEGNEAAVVGSGGLDAIARMTGLHLLGAPGGHLDAALDVNTSTLMNGLGAVLWAVGVVLLWRSALRPALGVALVPLLGVLADRAYWGFLAMPVCLLALGGLPGYPVTPEPAGAASRTPPWRRGREATTAP